MGNPTQRQIAAAAGVNVSTVSRALADSPNLPAATKRRILAVARKMGWRPNPLASAYMAHLRGTRDPAYKSAVGFLVDYAMPRGISSLPGHIQQHLRGARERAAAYGYRIEPISLREPGMDMRTLDRMLYHRGIPGFIVSGFQESGQAIHGIDWRRYAAVALGLSLTEPLLHRVAANVSHGFRLMLDRAIALGYRRIAVILSESYDRRVDHGALYPVSYARDRMPAGCSIETLVLATEQRSEFATIQTWLREHRPEVVIGTDLVWGAIESMEWNIPEDVAFIAVDRSPKYPETAGFNHRHDIQGGVAVDVLVAQITNNLRGVPAYPLLHFVDGNWEDGPSAPGLPRGFAG